MVWNERLGVEHAPVRDNLAEEGNKLISVVIEGEVGTVAPNVLTYLRQHWLVGQLLPQVRDVSKKDSDIELFAQGLRGDDGVPILKLDQW
jgi:hypothetical protein